MRRLKRDPGSRIYFDQKIRLPTNLQIFDEEKDTPLFKSAQRGNIEAINTLIERNYGLVIAHINGCVSNKTGDKLTQEDYFQYGVEGLRKAILKFNPKRGIKFSTYASFWIRQAMFRAFYQNYSDFNFPIHLFKHKTRLREAKKKVNSILEASKIANIGERLLSQMMSADPRSKSTYLNPKYELESEPALMIDKVADNSCVETIEHDLMCDELMMALKKILNKKEYEVIVRRFGLVDADNCPRREAQTLETIGKDMGLSRERIRQIEVLAITKLREDERFIGFREYLKE